MMCRCGKLRCVPLPDLNLAGPEAGGDSRFESFEAGWAEFASRYLSLGVAFGEDEGFAAWGSAAIEDALGKQRHVTAKFGDELGAFFLDADFASLESLSSSDIAGKNAARGGEDRSGSELDPLFRQLRLRFGVFKADGELRLLLALNADRFGGLWAVDLGPPLDQPNGVGCGFGQLLRIDDRLRD